jgi:hypothetical protein
MERLMKICSARLTTCGVLHDGQMVNLDLVDDAGAAVSLQLPFDQAQAIAMTLPSLLTHALRSITGSATARYVFPLDRWTVEQSKEHKGLLVTLATDEGFQVSFGIPAEACRGLGLTLAGVSGQCVRPDASEDETQTVPAVALN